nr:MAG TPA: hypothetical protein [Caudoviricetes sp.]
MVFQLIIETANEVVTKIHTITFRYFDKRINSVFYP